MYSANRIENYREREGQKQVEFVLRIFIKGRRCARKDEKSICKAPGAAKCKVIYRRFQGEQIALAASSYEFLEDAAPSDNDSFFLFLRALADLGNEIDPV